MNGVGNRHVSPRGIRPVCLCLAQKAQRIIEVTLSRHDMGARHDRREGKRGVQREQLTAAMRMSRQAGKHLVDLGKRRRGHQSVADVRGSMGKITCLDILAGHREHSPHILVPMLVWHDGTVAYEAPACT